MSIVGWCWISIFLMVIMDVKVWPIMAISLTLTGVAGKYGQNVDHRWKRFWKRLILRNFMAKTKKCEKRWPFLGNFLCKIGQILKLMARVTGCSKNPENFFGCSSYIYTAMDKLPGWNSIFFIFHDRLLIRLECNWLPSCTTPSLSQIFFVK